MVDIPGGQPMQWNTSPSRFHIPVGKVFRSLSGEPIVVLEYLGAGIGWNFHDTAGFPPPLVKGSTYKVDLDFWIAVYSSSDWGKPYPVPVYTKEWSFHSDPPYTVK